MGLTHFQVFGEKTDEVVRWVKEKTGLNYVTSSLYLIDMIRGDKSMMDGLPEAFPEVIPYLVKETVEKNEVVEESEIKCQLCLSKGYKHKKDCPTLCSKV